MFSKTVLLLFSLEIVLRRVFALYECCPGENIVSLTRKVPHCKGSTNETILGSCLTKISVGGDDIGNFDFWHFLPNQTLIDTSAGRFVNYCYYYKDEDRNNSTLSYVLCMDRDDGDESFFTRHKMDIQAGLTCISTAFVLLTMIIYLSVPSLLDIQGICKMHVLGGLASSYIILTIVQHNEFSSNDLCKSAAYLMYFSFFYMFFWLTVLSFDIWRTSVKPNLSNGAVKWPIVYHVVGIGGALLALIVILLAHYSPAEFWIDLRPNFGEGRCWFESRKLTWIYFYGPISVLLVINIAFYLCTVIVLWKKVNNSRSKILKYRLKICTQLYIIMGITWCFEVISFAIDPDTNTLGEILIFLLDLFNMLQGILIFLVLVVFRKRVRRVLANKNICNIQFPSSWRYLEDEEMESVEAKANCTIVEYDANVGEVDDEVRLKG